MKITKVMLWVAAVAIGVGGLAYSEAGDGGFRGPCVPATTAWVPVAACEPSCSLVCWDRYSPVTITDGKCRGYSEQSCTLWTSLGPKEKWVDCDCPFLGGLCITKAEADSGLQWCVTCTGGGVDDDIA